MHVRMAWTNEGMNLEMKNEPPLARDGLGFPAALGGLCAPSCLLPKYPPPLSWTHSIPSIQAEDPPEVMVMWGRGRVQTGESKHHFAQNLVK